MTSILCLAHYCDVHGPTPLMVTEGLPVPCSVCYDNELPIYSITSNPTDKPRSSVPDTAPQPPASVDDFLRRMNMPATNRSSSGSASEHDAQIHRAQLLRSAQGSSPPSAMETPPQSPRQSQESQQAQLQSTPSRQESGFRKTYDDYVTRRAGPCENCALTLPRRQERGNGAAGGGADSRPDRGPTLRTRAPCARVLFSTGGESASPPSSHVSSSSPSDDDEAPPSLRTGHRRTGTTASTGSRSTTSTLSQSAAHVHYLDYTSSHEPLTPATFSFVRASCLRTLSFETLPRPSATGVAGSSSTSSTPTASPVTPAFVTTHSAGSAASGGPIFFGDPSAGYTTAYIFRIPDVHARGHKRVYAFLALSTHREHLAMKTFSFVSAAFRDMAAWIQGLAEAEAERALSEGGSSSDGSPIIPNSRNTDGRKSTSADASSSHTSGSQGSSFLTGAMGGFSRRMGGGSGILLKQRGLPELVGMPDFFIELHTRFVRLLLELGVVLGS